MSTETEESARDWHLDRRLQISHIIGTWIAVASAVLYVGDIRKDVEIIKAEKVVQVARDLRQDQDATETKIEAKARYDRIEDKLDKLIEYLRPVQRSRP